MTDLIPMDITPAKLFTEKGLDPILEAVKKKVDEFKPDAESVTGRKEITSFAYKIAQSKTFIEKAGKELVSKQKAAIKLIDTERKRSRDFLDEQRDRARLPLTRWEEAEEKLIAEEAAKIELEADHTEALEFHTLWLKEKELEELKAKIAKDEEEKRQEEEAERFKKKMRERDRLLKKEAAAAAKIEAEEALAAEKERTIRLEVEAKAEKEGFEQAKKDAAEKAEREKKEAVERAKREVEEKALRDKAIAERIAAEAKAKADRKAAHHKHRKKVEGDAIVSFTNVLGCTQDEAYELVKVIKNNEIENVTINY